MSMVWFRRYRGGIEIFYIFKKFFVATIIEKTSTGNIIEFVSQDTPGLKRWLLSQSDALTVLSPQSLIDDVKTLIKRMQENYID